LSRNAWLVLFLALLSGSASASDEDYYRQDRPYASEGNWRISVNVARKSCFMASGSKSEAGFEVGGDLRSGRMNYFFLFDTPSATYKNYEHAAVTIKYDQRSRWVGDGFGVKFGDYSGVGIEGVNVDVVNEIADAEYLNLTVNDRDLGHISLAGSRKALAKMRQCIAAMNIIDISLAAIAGGNGTDVTSPPSPTPPLVPLPTPTPKEDESKRGDVLAGGAEDGASRGKGKRTVLDEEYYIGADAYANDLRWFIFTNPARKSCYMTARFGSETKIEVGGDQRGSALTYFLLFSNDSWTYEQGKDYDVTIGFDDHSPWVGDGGGLRHGVAVEGVSGGGIDELAAAQDFSLKIGDRDFGKFELKDVPEGLAMLRQCMAGMEGGSISQGTIAGADRANIPSPPAPTPAPKEDEGKRADTQPGGTEDGSAGGKDKEPIQPSGPSSALDEDYYASDKIYAKEGNWWVFVTRARKSCSMAATFDGAAEIEVGGDHRRGELSYFLVFSKPSWDYEQGKDYEVTVEYDRGSVWAGDGIGVRLTEQKGVALEGVNAEAVDDFAAAKTLGLKIGSREHGTFDLNGSREGIAKLRECIAAVDDGRISLAEIDGTDKADIPSPSAPAPTPKKDETRPDDALPSVPEGGQDRGKGKELVTAYGSGFFVDDAGYLLTNAHVVRHCGDTRLRFGDGRIASALIVAGDEANDLALLKIRGRSPAFAKFRGAPPIRLGESVVVFGYPLSGYLSKSGNLSTGLVASLAGAGDNEAEMQISAPVQSGNSGGAVVDQSGHIVGVVVAKSNTKTINKDYVEVIQNANFAIKADVAKAFLDRLGVPYETEPPGEDLKTPDVADIVRASSAQVICEMSELD
jgi:S1-C subfamily serine protease